jgi:hypothetical protein
MKINKEELLLIISGIVISIMIFIASSIFNYYFYVKFLGEL